MSEILKKVMEIRESIQEKNENETEENIEDMTRIIIKCDEELLCRNVLKEIRRGIDIDMNECLLDEMNDDHREEENLDDDDDSKVKEKSDQFPPVLSFSAISKSANLETDGIENDV